MTGTLLSKLALLGVAATPAGAAPGLRCHLTSACPMGAACTEANADYRLHISGLPDAPRYAVGGAEPTPATPESLDDGSLALTRRIAGAREVVTLSPEGGVTLQIYFDTGTGDFRYTGRCEEAPA